MIERCGYRFLTDVIAEQTGAWPLASSPSGWSFGVKALAQRYERCGLETVIVDKPEGGKVVQSAACKLCGVFDSRNIDHKDGQYFKCDPEKHRAYYDSFLSVG